MPRGPGKKENYNLDYSRFNRFDHDEADQENEDSKASERKDEADAAGGLPEFRDLLRGMPVELQEAYHLMSIAKANGDTEAQQRASALALKAVEKGGPEVKNAFMENVAKQMPEIAGTLNKDMAGIDAGAVIDELQNKVVQKEVAKATGLSTADVLQDSEDRIDKLRQEMEEGQKATRKELDNLQKKQDDLERIRNPEDFMKFMTEEGITQEDLQRIFSGDEAHMKARLNETIEKRTGEDKGKSQDALKRVDELHGALFGTKPEEEPTQAPEPAPTKPVKRVPAKPKEPEVTVPMYRLQYEKDEAGKYMSVELKCTLPGVADMSAINLDVSEKHLRLSTAAAPRYAVNAGPFPVLIDPNRARAKYSKKREELSISVPAKLD